MAMGTRRQRQRQEELWYRGDLAEAPGHPFYRRLNELLDQAGFDEFCEARCQKFYHEKPPEAEITRMKDGRTALAYKAEHAVDMDTGAIVTVTAHDGAVGDTSS